MQPFRTAGLITLLLFTLQCPASPLDSFTRWLGSYWSNWEPQNVRLECRLPAECPPGVGALIYAYIKVDAEHPDGTLQAGACTASLILDRGKILTSGHCDVLEDPDFINAKSKKVIFMLPRQPGKESTWQNVVATDFKILQNYQDLSILRLAKPIADVQPMQLSRVPQIFPATFTTFVVEVPSAEKFFSDTFYLGKRTCDTSDPGYPDPDMHLYTVVEGFNCGIVRGNSGGPVFAGDATSAIEGVIQGYSMLMLNMQFATRVSCIAMPGLAPVRGKCLDYSGRMLTNVMERITLLANDLTEQLTSQMQDQFVLPRHMQVLAVDPDPPAKEASFGLYIGPAPLCWPRHPQKGLATAVVDTIYYFLFTQQNQDSQMGFVPVPERDVKARGEARLSPLVYHRKVLPADAARLSRVLAQQLPQRQVARDLPACGD